MARAMKREINNKRQAEAIAVRAESGGAGERIIDIIGVAYVPCSR